MFYVIMSMNSGASSPNGPDRVEGLDAARAMLKAAAAVDQMTASQLEAVESAIDALEVGGRVDFPNSGWAQVLAELDSD